MNPLTNMKNVKKLSDQELKMGNKTSWHDQYKDSAWVFVGGLPYDLTEGDIICVFSQYGEIVNINLVRDKDTGKQKGFCFICYEDQRSTVLAVDNLNGIKILSRTIRVDHVSDYKVPKESKKLDEETRKLQNEGCAPGSFVSKPVELPTDVDVDRIKEELSSEDIRLPERLPIGPSNTEVSEKKRSSKKKEKKHKKDKKKKKKMKKLKKKSRRESSDSDSSSYKSDVDSVSSKDSCKKRKIKTENDESNEHDSSKIRRIDFDSRDTYSRRHGVSSDYDYKKYKYSSQSRR